MISARSCTFEKTVLAISRRNTWRGAIVPCQHNLSFPCGHPMLIGSDAEMTDLWISGSMSNRELKLLH